MQTAMASIGNENLSSPLCLFPAVVTVHAGTDMREVYQRPPLYRLDGLPVANAA